MLAANNAAAVFDPRRDLYYTYDLKIEVTSKKKPNTVNTSLQSRDIILYSSVLLCSLDSRIVSIMMIIMPSSPSSEV